MHSQARNDINPRIAIKNYLNSSYESPLLDFLFLLKGECSVYPRNKELVRIPKTS